MTRREAVRQIAEVAHQSLSYGNLITLDAIALAHAKVNGSMAAKSEVEDYRSEWVELLAENGYAIVPATAEMVKHAAAGTQPKTVAEKKACVAGTGWGRKCVAIYWAKQGDSDPFYRWHAKSRAAKKNGTKLARDLDHARISATLRGEIEGGVPNGTLSLNSVPARKPLAPGRKPKKLTP